MRKSTPILLAVALLLTVSLACAVSGVPGVPAPTQDLNLLGTAIMSTLVSGVTQTAVAAPSLVVVDSPTPWPTFTPTFAVPTDTPSATLSPTPVFTSTSLVPLISVSVPTNCRVGPGKVYERVGGLAVGQVAEVVGRNPAGTYWYIRNPNNPNGFCWLWGEYATLTGNFAALPIFTPPPTPTPVPDFRVVYAGLEKCSDWWADVRVINTGGVAFESLSLTMRDTTNNVVVSMYTDVFHNRDGCTGSTTKDVLNPGARHVVSGPEFSYNPTGHELRATITLCTREGQNGFCLTKSLSFTP